MGLLDIFKNAKKTVEEPKKDAQRLSKKVIKQQMYRFNQELRDWKIGVNNFEDPFNPITVDLIRVYNDIVIDAHLSAAIESRIIRTTSKDFKIVDEKGEEVDDETGIFSAPWFRHFLKLALESKFYGYSLIQFDDLKGKRFKSVELFPREYVYPQKNAVRLSPYSSNDLVYYDEAPFEAWTMGVGRPSDIGLLMKAAPLVIFKKTALGSWTEFAELFGAPFRLGKTNVRDTELRDNMFNMLENMGRNAFGVFDTDDTLEFVRDGKTDSHNVFNQLIERTNSELSKLILGSTMTMDEGSSRSQSEVHERTSAAINKEDAFFILSVVNDELIPWLNKYHGFNIKGRFIFDDTENTTKTEQFAIDSELVKLGFNVPKNYFTDTYGTPIDEKEEEDDEPTPPKGKEEAESDELENSIKKKTTLANIYAGFTSESSLHVCNELDYEDTPPPEWSDSYVDEIITGVYSGLYTINNLPKSLYEEIGRRLTQGLYDGLATGNALTTIADPGYINTLRNNIYTFSGAKTWNEVKLMSDFLIDENGNARSFKEYKDFAKKTFGEFNVNYLRTEINHAKGTAQMADKWKQFDEEVELFPFLRYVTAGDDRVRPSHKALNGIIKPVNDPFWKQNAPLNGWNCRCDLKQVEEAVVTTDEEIEAKINEATDGKGLDTPDYMKNNPGRDVFGKDHPYFKIPRAFKKDQANNFGMPAPKPMSDEAIVKEIKKAQKSLVVDWSTKSNKAIKDHLTTSFVSKGFKVDKVVISTKADKTALSSQINQLDKLLKEYKVADEWKTENGFELLFNTKKGYYGAIHTHTNPIEKRSWVSKANFGHREPGPRQVMADKQRSKEGEFNRKSKADSENYDIVTTTHEFAHFIAVELLESSKVVSSNTKEFFTSLRKIRDDYRLEMKALSVPGGYKEQVKIHLGDYANTNTNEFMAEAFTEYKLNSNPSKYAKKVGILIDKHFKK